jgi:hypothetical protein
MKFYRRNNTKFLVHPFLPVGNLYQTHSITVVDSKEYNTQDNWVFGLFPSSGILKNAVFLKLDLFPSSGEEVGDTYSVGSLIKS